MQVVPTQPRQQKWRQLGLDGYLGRGGCHVMHGHDQLLGLVWVVGGHNARVLWWAVIHSVGLAQGRQRSGARAQIKVAVEKTPTGVWCCL